MYEFDDDEKATLQKDLICPQCGIARSKGSSAWNLERYSRYAGRRFLRPGFLSLCLTSLLLLWMLFGSSNEDTTLLEPQPTEPVTVDEEDIALASYNASETKLHFLITANTVDLDLCKTLLTSGILTYPSPTILSPNQKDVSRFSRIPRVLDYVKSLDATHAEDLVLIVNGHEIQFQLPIDILLNRYNAISRAANEDLTSQLDGSRADGPAQKILFGANKRCTSAATSEESCDPTPPSPATDDLYGNYTDVAESYNNWFHYRPKYVDPGFIFGPLGAIRTLFERAEQIVEESKKTSGLAIMTEQAVFTRIFSDQERWRESIRSHDSRGADSWLVSDGRTSPSEKKATSPTKEVLELDPAVNYEFGMFVDYYSQLSHSTLDSTVGRDTQFIIWNDDDSTTFREQANNKHHRDGKLDCVVDVPASLPADIISMGPPFYLLKIHDNRKGSTYDHAPEEDGVYRGPQWTDVALYTHLCFGTVPAMIHHSGNTEARNQTWEHLWLRQRSNALLHMQQEMMAQDGSGAVNVSDWTEFKQSPGVKVPGGAWVDDGLWADWSEICPADVYGEALFHKTP